MAERVSKRYILRQRGSMLRSALNALAGVPRETESGADVHVALDGVSFALARGEVVGLIGRNGAGKTTILRLVAGITYPSEGKLSVSGKVSALIALGAGFHPELSGRDNVFLNGVILGMSRREMASRYSAIVDFAELHEFMDVPVKRYSSGMHARLGFAVAAHTDPDVLLVDEVLAVGDTAFQVKCMERMRYLTARGTTLLLVSHNMDTIQRVCERTLVLSDGKLIFDGDSDEAIAQYYDDLRYGRTVGMTELGSGGLADRVVTGQARIERCQVAVGDDDVGGLVTIGAAFAINVVVRFSESVSDPIVACTVRNGRGDLAYDISTRACGVSCGRVEAGERLIVSFECIANLVPGVYHVKVDVAHGDLKAYYDYVPNAVSLVVRGAAVGSGIADLRGRCLLSRA